MAPVVRRSFSVYRFFFVTSCAFVVSWLHLTPLRIELTTPVVGNVVLPASRSAT